MGKKEKKGSPQFTFLVIYAID